MARAAGARRSRVPAERASVRKRKTTRRRTRSAKREPWRTHGDKSRLLALDISGTAVGWVLFVDEQPAAHGKYRQVGEGHAERLHRFVDWLTGLFHQYAPTQVAIEAPYMGRFPKAFAALQLYRAAALIAHWAAFFAELPAENQLPAHTIKRVLGLGKPNVPKADVHDANKYIVCAEINAIYGTNFQFVKDDKKKLKSDDDIADAYAVAHAWLALWQDPAGAAPEAPDE